MKKINLLLYCLLLQTTFLAAQTDPNFIVIYIDDMSWNETQLQMDANYVNSGSDYHLSPNIIQLAQQGMKFTQGYGAAPKCSPARASLLTGKSTGRTGYTDVAGSIDSTRIIYGISSWNRLQQTHTTIAEQIKTLNNNYITAHFGKWHLDAQGPANHGFDRSDGNTTNSEGDTGSSTDPKKMFSITDSTIAVMQDAVQGNKPFYIQLSHYAVHTTLEATPNSMTMFQNLPVGSNHTDALMAAMVYDLDNSIGTLMTELTTLGLDNNTYVIFTSDHGGTGFNNNIPLSKGKNFIYEGGVRVPFIVKGPNIPANTTSTVPVISYDIFPTIVEWITGSTASVPASVDGTSLVPILHNTGTITRQYPITFHNPHHNSNHTDKVPRSAIIEGNYKLLTNYETGVFELYDLDTDIGETTNLFTTQTTIGQDLCLKLRDYLKDVNATMPTLNPQFITTVGPANDLDNDGLDDVWEFRELLTTKYDGTDDPDGDGANNLMEFNNGTDPYTFLISTNSLEKKDNIQLFPNPTKDRLEITIEIPAKVQVFNTIGQFIQGFSIQNNTTIDVSKWAKGLYFLVFEQEGQFFTKRVVVE